MQKTRKNRKGFTLVELMVVVVIIGILTAIAIPVYMSVTANALEKSCKANQRIYDSGIMMWKSENPDSAYSALTMAILNNYVAEIPTCAVCNYGIDEADGLCATSAKTAVASEVATMGEHKLHTTATITTP